MLRMTSCTITKVYTKISFLFSCKHESSLFGLHYLCSMSEDTYKTIVAPSEGIYTEKRSKFIAIALPVRTVEEVKAHLELTRRNTTRPPRVLRLHVGP